MRASTVQAPGRSRVLGRRRAHSAPAGLLMRIVTHQQSARLVLLARILDAARRSATSARPVRLTVT